MQLQRNPKPEISRPHWEALTSDTQELYKRLATLPFISEFYLAGGTGLAIQIGHRLSIDLDFFSDSPESVGAEHRDALIKLLTDDPSLTVVWDKDGTFAAHWRKVGVSFFRLNRHPLTLPPLWSKGLRVATIEEIGAMKLAAILSRGNRKDYIDLYFILQQTNLKRLFETAASKYPYNAAFPAFATRALAYFEDAESDPMPQMIITVGWEQIKDFLEKEAFNIGRQQLELEKLWQP